MTRRRWVRGEIALLLLGLAAIGVLAFVLTKASMPSGSAVQRPARSLKPARVVAAAGDRYQELAALTTPHQVFAAPGFHPFQRISSTRPITGERTVLPVLSTSAHHGVNWLHVQLPGRPNGLTGWIASRATKLEYTPWRIVVNLAKRRVYAYHTGHVVRSFRAVVGARATPTPRGQFFVEESVIEPPSAVGHPYALALSARSNVLQDFDGGPGQIALHGLDNVGGTPGTAASHGCVRLTTSDISWLAGRINPGVPVIVY
jgi:lipoprotein-anchoring transpeptidase ErfK/SrfK